MFAGAGAVAPDNRTAAVPIRRNGVHQILLIDLDTAATRQLTSLEWRAVEVGNFSPDGRHLVYSVPARADGPDRRIHVIAASGESDRVLVDAPGQHRSPFFSPDGRHVAFVSNRSGGRWDLWRVPVVEGRPSGTLEAISTDIGSVANLGFASDGRLFHQKAVDLQDAYEVDIDQEKRAVGAPARVSDRAVGVSAAPKWSRDGKWLAYIVRRGLSGRYDVGELAVVVRSEDGHERQVSLAPHAAADARFFQWFPDRQSLLFVQYGPRGRRFRQLDLATGRVDTLFEAPQSVLNAVISADGRNIVYPSTDPDDRTLKHLVSRDLSTSTDAVLLSARNMGNGPAAFHGLTLAPDGRRFAYLTRGVNVGNLRGGGPQEVWRPSEGRLWPQAMVWDAEGRAVFVTVVHTGSEDRELWYVGIDGEAHAVGIAMPQLEVTSAHPAGRRLGLTAGTDVVQVWAVSGLFPGSRNAPAP
jgi:Tol biopolymer transport system component